MTDTESKLFLSCDLVASTQHKRDEPRRWPHAFLSFYRDFPIALANQAREDRFGRSFELWKSVGDELIFMVTIRHEREVFEAIEVWLNAMKAYEDGTMSVHGLRVKGGAFVATFPGPDCRVSTPLAPDDDSSGIGVVELNDEAWSTGDRTKYLYDFIGPSFDAGFQVLALSDERYFTLSIEAAWAYSRGAQSKQVTKKPALQLIRKQALRGIWHGRPYPVLAIDRRHQDPVNVALSSFEPGRPGFSEIDALCFGCSQSVGWPSAMFLPSSDFAPFKQEPVDVFETLRAAPKAGVEEPVPEESGVEMLISRVADNAPLGARR